MDLKIHEPLLSCICYFYILHSTLYILDHLTLLEHFVVIVELYQGSGGPPGPSWAQNGPKNGSCEAKSRGLSIKKGPARVL